MAGWKPALQYSTILEFEYSCAVSEHIGLGIEFFCADGEFFACGGVVFTNLHCGGNHICGSGDLNGMVFLLRAKFRIEI
jgi:hypothetical protein